MAKQTGLIQPAILPLNESTPTSIAEKDLGSIKIFELPLLPHDLERIEKDILRNFMIASGMLKYRKHSFNSFLAG